MEAMSAPRARTPVAMLRQKNYSGPRKLAIMMVWEDGTYLVLTHRSSDDGKEDTYRHTYPAAQLRWSLPVCFHCCTGLTEIDDGFDEEGAHELAVIRMLALDGVGRARGRT